MSTSNCIYEKNLIPLAPVGSTTCRFMRGRTIGPGVSTAVEAEDELIQVERRRDRRPAPIEYTRWIRDVIQTVPVHNLAETGGRIAPDSPAGLNRNGRSGSTRSSGRFQPNSVAALPRIVQVWEDP